MSQLTRLIEPYGGQLVDLVVSSDEAAELIEYAKTLASIRLSERSICDLEMLATGAFSPLDRFMTSADYSRVLNEMRLASGHIFPVPVTLPIESRDEITEGKRRCVARREEQYPRGYYRRRDL